MKELIWSVSAETDLYEIADHYAQFDPSLPDLILRRIADAPLILLDNPWIGPPAGHYELRKWLVRKTPFLLLYRVAGESVEVVRVVHSASDWQELLT